MKELTTSELAQVSGAGVSGGDVAEAAGAG